MQINSTTQIIKSKAKQFGFDHCGVSKAGFLEEDAIRLESWLKKNRQGKMQYMENHFDKRLDPRKLVPGAKSVVSLLFNYFPKHTLNIDSPTISKYAYGTDYHQVLKEKLFALVDELQNEIGKFSFRVFVDSAPVLERTWAAKSGLGWIGKNGNLINKKSGSFFFLTEIICDLELETDHATTDNCGTCTRCLDTCPTEAILPGKEIDGSKCISYFTIELKEAIPNNMKGKWADWVFGCDVCQDVCPWNKFSKPTNEKSFEPEVLNQFSKQDWMDMTEEIFNQQFKNSPISRTGFSGMKRNLRFINPD